ncbi:hypothetical protein DVH05_011383 [Phytophthora capsici]|nr:hypothetical protein DVH05_011383 [Phytophthora capsici]
MEINVEDMETNAAKATINGATTSTTSVEGDRKVTGSPVGTTAGRVPTAVGVMESEATMTEGDTGVPRTRRGMVAGLRGMTTEGATETLLVDMTKVTVDMTTAEVMEALQTKVVEDMTIEGDTEALRIIVMVVMRIAGDTGALLAMTTEETIAVHLADTTKAAVATIIEEATGRPATAAEEPTMTVRADTLEVHTMNVRVAGTGAKTTAVMTEATVEVVMATAATIAVLEDKATADMAGEITDKIIEAMEEMQIVVVTTVDKIAEATEAMGIGAVTTVDKITEATEEEVGIEAETTVVTANKETIGVEETEADVVAVVEAVALEEVEALAAKKDLAPGPSPALDTNKSATRSRILGSKMNGVAELVSVTFKRKIPICSSKCRFVVAPESLELVKLCS